MHWQNSEFVMLRRHLTLDCHDRLVDCYASYFGALTCVAWSPDGRFILVGWNCNNPLLLLN